MCSVHSDCTSFLIFMVCLKYDSAYSCSMDILGLYWHTEQKPRWSCMYCSLSCLYATYTCLMEHGHTQEELGGWIWPSMLNSPLKTKQLTTASKAWGTWYTFFILILALFIYHCSNQLTSMYTNNEKSSLPRSTIQKCDWDWCLTSL